MILSSRGPALLGLVVAGVVTAGCSALPIALALALAQASGRVSVPAVTAG